MIPVQQGLKTSKWEQPSIGWQLSIVQLLPSSQSVGWPAVQILLPLRHFLYPGNVSWTEEGHTFAWHMKLRSKSARGSFTLTDSVTGEERAVRPAELLTERQQRKMLTRPDLIVQFALYAERLYVEETGRSPEDVVVTARVRAGLNGRRMQPLIQRDVDLTAVERVLWPPADWIVPLRTPLQPPD